VIAEELQAQPTRYPADDPDERGQILTEAAQAWQRAGEHERAITLLGEAIALGGEDGAGALVALAEVHFDRGDTAQAQAQLDELRHQRPPTPMPYHLAAELLEERGEAQQALTWFNMAISRLSKQEMAQRDTEFGFFSYAHHLLAGRRRVRHTLGLPADEWDNSAQALSDQATDQLEDLAHTLAPPAPPREVRVLFWPRQEIPHAHHTWPQLVEHTDAEAIIAEREAANRELSRSGIARITMVPLTTATLLDFSTRTGSDPTDSDTRLACMNDIVADGNAISWPPARNAPCWCGSTAKYKKCCGRPNPN
jgi:tetratricopeptide (TPR) repeat protein